MRPSSIIVSVLRSFAILIVLIGGSLFLQCATSPTPKPTSTDAGIEATPTPVPIPVTGCDAACANVAKLKCKYFDRCPSTCRLLQNQSLINCMINETSCENIDYCNKNHG